MQKKILITGGSSGIGRGLATHFYNKGWQVLATGRNKDKLSDLQKEMPGIHIIEYDNLLNNQEEKIFSFIKNKWNSSLDVLVNNAGHVELTPLKEVDVTAMEKMYRAHLIAPSIIAAGCVDFLTETKGQIINVSSSHGIKAFPLTSAYGSAKAGMNMLTKIWALELAPLGVRVNAVAPGPTSTDILASAGFSAEVIAAIHSEEAASIPLQRRGEIDDIVKNTALLIDSGSKWLTGVILPVDGGISIS